MQFDRLRRRWLQDEVAELRKELAAVRAELDRLRVTPVGFGAKRSWHLVALV